MVRLLVICALTKLTASEVNFKMTYLKSRKVKEKSEVTGIINDGEPCSKNAKVSKSNPKKDIIFTYEEPPNPDIVRRRQWDYVYYPGNEEIQKGGVRF
uniref:Uncharacterized protein n=1 Tax=Amphimedon queenslandica TaxID=400682 RepID=A0A1X7TSW6_AMPQE